MPTPIPMAGRLPNRRGPDAETVCQPGLRRCTGAHVEFTDSHGFYVEGSLCPRSGYLVTGGINPTVKCGVPQPSK